MHCGKDQNQLTTLNKNSAQDTTESTGDTQALPMATPFNGTSNVPAFIALKHVKIMNVRVHSRTRIDPWKLNKAAEYFKVILLF